MLLAPLKGAAGASPRPSLGKEPDRGDSMWEQDRRWPPLPLSTSRIRAVSEVNHHSSCFVFRFQHLSLVGPLKSWAFQEQI